MKKLFLEIDRLLRGELTSDEQLSQGKITIAARRLGLICLLLGAVYGIFMGIYGATRDGNPASQQLLASMVKVPMVFLLTLFVTYPSLYVFSALAGSSCRSVDTLRLLVASIGINLAILASFGPITGFFTLSTVSYPFMVLLNVTFFGVSGLIGLGFLRRALERVIAGPVQDEFVRAVSVAPPPVPPTPQAPKEQDGAPDDEKTSAPPVGGPTPDPMRTPPADAALRPPAEPTPSPRGASQPASTSTRAVVVFRIWVIIYGIVGAQMGWILRPFIGTPDAEFSWFRARSGSFLQGVGKAIAGLFQ